MNGAPPAVFSDRGMSVPDEITNLIDQSVEDGHGVPGSTTALPNTTNKPAS
jgi:hypothetical protein